METRFATPRVPQTPPPPPPSEGDVAEKWLDYIVFTRVPVVGHALLQRQLYVAEVIASHLQLVPQVQLVHTSTTKAFTPKVKIFLQQKLTVVKPSCALVFMITVEL